LEGIDWASHNSNSPANDRDANYPQQGGILKRILAVLIVLLAGIASLALANTNEAWGASRSVNIPCGADIDNVINNDPSGTATIFVLGADCTFTASATVVPKNGDEIHCQIRPTGTILAGSWPLAAVDPATRCTIQGASTLATVMKPRGYFYGEGFTVRGGDFKGSAGTGVGIQEGQMSNNSYLWRVIVRDNEAAGISVGRGTHDEVELTNNTTNPQALGFIGSGIKSAYEFSVQHSYVHDTQGNGMWCDVHCKNVSGAPFSAAHFNANLVVNNGRAGIRWERIGKVRCGSDCDPNAGQGIIENNFVHGNGRESVRGGIDVRDSQDALVRNNVFGAATYAGISYPPNARSVAIRVTDSGRTDRPDLYNIDVVNNGLNGETITGCSLPDDVVFCQ
jgi:hypothetical protein